MLAWFHATFLELANEEEPLVVEVTAVELEKIMNNEFLINDDVDEWSLEFAE